MHLHYPGLAADPGHEIARRQMDGFGGMLSFEIRGAVADAERFASRLRIFTLAISLGGVESLVCFPSRTSHALAGAAERARMGVTDNLLRMSVGIEDSEDLIRDLTQALE